MELWGCKVETYHRRNRGSAGFGFQMGFIENNWILLVSCETLWANWRKMSWDFTTYQDFSSLDFIFTVWTWSSTLSLISDTGLITHTHMHTHSQRAGWTQRVDRSQEETRREFSKLIFLYSTSFAADLAWPDNRVLKGFHSNSSGMPESREERAHNLQRASTSPRGQRSGRRSQRKLFFFLI